MTKAVLLRVHRWIFVVFAIPLAVIIVTGLILSFQPILQTTAIRPGSITLAQIDGHLARHDPEGKARGLSIDHFERSMSIQGIGPGGSVAVDLRSGGEADDEGWIGTLMSWARPVHEHFVFRLQDITGVPIVLVSTVGMASGMLIGIMLGWPRIQNTVSGWHKATAWVLLPLLLLSPLTGILMAFRLSLGPAPERAAPVALGEALRMVAAKHDLSGLQWIRTRGGRQMALVSEGKSRFSYVVSKDGLKPAPANLPRTFHQGDFFGIWGGVMNVVLSLALTLLLVTGLWIWGKRTFRRRKRVRPQAVAATG